MNGLTPSTSAPRLGAYLPHLHHDLAPAAGRMNGRHVRYIARVRRALAASHRADGHFARRVCAHRRAALCQHRRVRASGSNKYAEDDVPRCLDSVHHVPHRTVRLSNSSIRAKRRHFASQVVFLRNTVGDENAEFDGLDSSSCDTWSMQHAADDKRHPRCAMQCRRGMCEVKHARCDMHAPRAMQQATCNRLSAGCNRNCYNMQ